jgi:hypothetical protein
MAERGAAMSDPGQRDDDGPVIDCDGDPAALRVYLPDGWADEAATILAAVFRG